MTLIADNDVVLDLVKLKKLREKRGLSQEQAAQAAGMRLRQQWYEIEKGLRKNITLDTLNRIAAALGVRAKDLLK
jgi:transcriptional regulator with XRE-family HTH domain